MKKVTMEFLYLLAGLVLGALPAYFWARFQNSKQQTGLSRSDVEKQYVSKDRYQDLQQRLQESEARLSRSEKERHEMSKDVVAKEQKLSSLEERLEGRKVDLEKAQEDLSAKFEKLANSLFEEKKQQFKATNQEELDKLLQPLKQQIRRFEEDLQNQHNRDIAQYAGLKQQLEGLGQLHQQMSTDTRNLTKALKGQAQLQGSWGELVLEKVLEISGLRKGKEYSTQSSYKNAQGRLRKPDVVLHLPDEKKVIIDAKASLVAYERYCSTEDKTQREKAAKEHAQSVRQHIKGLSEKAYQNLEGIQSLDFVLLFMPIEAAFALAIETAPELFDEAYKANIVIVTPTTLLSTVRIIANIWRQEHQNANALEIAERGGKLYDKFVGFVDDLNQVQMRVRQTQESLDSAFNKLTTGQGNLQWQAEQLYELGAKANKRLEKQ